MELIKEELGLIEGLQKESQRLQKDGFEGLQKERERSQKERERLFSLFDSDKDKDIYKKILKTSIIKHLSPLIVDNKAFSIADLEELRSKTKDKEQFLGLSVIIYILTQNFYRYINLEELFDEKELAYLKKAVDYIKSK